MDNKHATIITDVAKQVEKLAEVRKHLAESYNNDMNKDAVKIIRHAEQVLQDYADSLK